MNPIVLIWLEFALCAGQIDIFQRPGSFYKEVGPGHVVSAGLGVILLTTAGLAQ